MAARRKTTTTSPQQAKAQQPPGKPTPTSTSSTAATTAADDGTPRQRQTEADVPHHLPPLALVGTVLVCSGFLCLLGFRDFATTGRNLLGHVDEAFLVRVVTLRYVILLVSFAITHSLSHTTHSLSHTTHS